MEKQLKQTSKLVSLVLRHEPEHRTYPGCRRLGPGARTNRKVNQKGIQLDFATLQIIVDTNDKKRFAFNNDKTCIRANQGHSIDVELSLTAQMPPAVLFHGTADKYLTAIRKHGLLKMDRQHVHLTAEKETA